MELLINCNASVNLTGLQSVKKVNAEFKDYKLVKDLLEGNVLIKGTYLKNNDEEENFEKEIPITVVFKEDDVKVVTVTVDDFKYYEIVNQGIECEFKTKVVYEEIEDGFLIDKDDVVDEDDKVEDYLDEDKDTDDNEIKEENEYDDLYEEITDDYDEMLDNILNDRVFEVSEENNKVNINEIVKENNNVSFRGVKDNYSSYRVYYINDERSLEDISKNENKSFEEIYRQNQDFETKKRIILK